MNQVHHTGKIREQLEGELAQAHQRMLTTDEKTAEQAIREAGDYTENKRAEEKLSVSELRYRRLFETARDGILILDADTGEIIDVNPFLTNMLGYSHEEFLGRKLWDIGIFIDTDVSKKAFRQLQRKEYIRYDHLPLVTKDLKQICVEFVSNVYQIDGEKVIQCNIRDTTKRKRAEEELRNHKDQLGKMVRQRTAELEKTNRKLQQDITEPEVAEETLQLAEQNFHNSLDTSPLGIRVVTADGELLYANQAILAIYGYSSVEELRATPTKLRYTPESYAKHQRRKEARKLGQPVPSNYEIAIVRKGGEVRYLDVFRKTVIWNGESQFQTIYVDKTERKQVEEKLRQSEAKYRTLVERLQEGVYQSDLQGNYITLNQVGARIFGFDSSEEVVGKVKTTDFYYDSSERAKIVESVRRNGFWKGEVRARRRDGATIWLYAYNSATLDAKGNIVGYEGVFTDITEAKEAEKKAGEVKLLKELDEMRTNLLARVSHELRTPMATIKGYSTMLLDYDERLGRDEKLKYIGSVDKACDRLTSLVDSLLDMSRLEAGLLKLEKKPGNISALIRETITDAQHRELKHKIVGDVKMELPQMVIDSKRIRQVLDNLIDNACKFSNEGTQVVISVELGGQELIISVTDHGIGIPAEDLDKVFSGVYQAKPGVTRKKSGLGLGLSISKGLVEAHGGRIWMESKVGQRTRCSFALPL